MNARPLALVVVLLATLAPRAHADGSPGKDSAYVTAAEPDWDSPSDGGDHCDLTLQLQGGASATAHEDDPDRSCFSYLHTWQPVQLDAADRAHVHVVLSRPLLWRAEGIMHWVLGITLGVLLLLVLAQWLVQKRRATAA